MLYVAESERGKGIGEALLLHAVANAPTNEFLLRPMSRTTECSGLFRRLGWSVSGLLHGLDDGDPELFYFIDRIGP